MTFAHVVVLFVILRQDVQEGLDVFEPVKVADTVQKLGLNHVVITSVDRDDLEDGGTQHFAKDNKSYSK